MKVPSFLISLGILAIVALGCSKFQEQVKKAAEPAVKPYVSQADGFSISVPAGSEEPSSTDDTGAYSDNKVQIYSTVKDSIGYRVKAITIGGYSDGFIKKMTVKDINDTVSDITMPWKDNGTLDVPGLPEDAEQKEVTFKGFPAIEASGYSNELTALGNMFKRQVLVWVADKKKAYDIEVFSKKKDDLMAKPVNDFFNSFEVSKE